MGDEEGGAGLSVDDRWLINDLLARYCFAVDTGEHELLRSVFSANAPLDYRAGGAGQGVGPDWFIGLAKGNAGSSQHSLGTSVVWAQSDGASGKTYVTARVIPAAGDGQVVVISGWYLDDFARSEDGWRIVARTFISAP